MDKSSYEIRIRKIVAAAAENGIDNTFITSPDGIRYLTGMAFSKGRRITGLLLNSSGSYIILPQMELGKIADAQTAVPKPYSEDEDYISTLGSLIKGSVGIEKEDLSVFRAEQIASGIGKKLENLQDVGKLLSSMRIIKDADEVNSLQTACDKTDALLGKWVRYVEPGINEYQLRRYLDELSISDGIRESCPGILIEGGINSSVAHGLSRPGALKRGDVLFIDCGARWDGYYCDITRTFFLGEPDEEMKKVYMTVLEAQLAAIDAVKPGAIPEDIDEIARDVIRKSGYGDFFTHGLGHGVGVSVHEEPYLRKGSRSPLRPGMVVTVEPGVYLPGRWGIRIEDDVLVTENGHRVFNHFPKSIESAVLSA